MHHQGNRVSGHVFIKPRQRGDQWYAKYRLPSGRQRQKRLGPAWTGRGRPPAGYLTKRTAEAELAALLTDARRGAGPAYESGATFSDAAAEYLRYVEEVRQIDPGTVADYRGVIEGYLRAEFGDTPLDVVTPDAIDAYKERLIADGQLSNRTDRPPPRRFARGLQARKAAFGARRRTPPPPSWSSGRRSSTRASSTPSTATRSSDSPAPPTSAQDAALYRVGGVTGLRQGELLGLRWGCVDFVGGLVHVRRNYTGGVDKIPKGKRVRSVPMIPAVIDTLARAQGARALQRRRRSGVLLGGR